MKEFSSSTNPEELLAYAGWVQGLAKSLVFDQDKVDDLVQETWLAALKPKKEKIENVRAWLARVTRNLGKQNWRTQTRRSRREEIASKEEALPSAAELTEHAELQTKIAQAVLKLEEPYRSTILLHYYEGLPLVEIASKLGVADSTVRNRLKRGLDQLRERFDAEHGGNRRAWSLIFLPLAIPYKLSSAAKVTGVSSFIGVMLAMSLKLKLMIALFAVLLGWLMLGKFSEPDQKSYDSSRLAANQAHEKTIAAPEATPLNTNARESLEVKTLAAKTQSLEVEIVHPDGQPASGARAILYQDENLFGVSLTDSSGIAKFETLFEGEAKCIVVGASYLPYTATVAANKKVQRIKLPEGADLSGTVLVDSKTPSPAVSLLIVIKLEDSLFNCSLPDIVQENLGDNEIYSSQGTVKLRQFTDVRGRFLISGLPLSATITIWPSDAYEIVGNAKKQKFVSAIPANELSISLTSLPAIKGRVLDIEGKRVSGARIIAATKCFSPDRSQYEMVGSDQVESDENGYFLIPYKIESYSICDLAVLISNPENTQHQNRSLKQIDRGSKLDLGDIQLEPGRNIDITVKDLYGNPIQGALAYSGRDDRDWSLEEPDFSIWQSHIQSKLTDASGKTTLEQIPKNEKFLSVYAPGFQQKRNLLTDSNNDKALTVFLEKTTSLEVRVKKPSGEALKNLFVVVYPDQEKGAYPIPLFHDDHFLPKKSIVNKLGVSTRLYRGFSYENSPLSEEGKVYFQGFIPDLPFTIELYDGASRLQTLPQTGLQKQEQRVVDLVVEQKPRPVNLLILDMNSKPVSSASLRIGERHVGDRKDAWITSEYQTDSEGRVHLDAVYTDSINLRIWKKGFAPYMNENIKIAESGETTEIRLEMPRSVRVHAVNKKGQAVAAACYSAIGETTKDYYYPKSTDQNLNRVSNNGIFEFSELPLETLRVHIDVGGRSFEFACSSGKSDVQFVIPEYGTILLQLDFPIDRNNEYIFMIENSGNDFFVVQLQAVGSNKTMIQHYQYQVREDEVRTRQATIPIAFPGEYEIEVQARNSDGEQIASYRSKKFTVQANQTSQVRITDKP